MSDTGTSAAADGGRANRDWWLRTALVLQRPRPVFVALRDDGRASAEERSEQVLLIVLLAGIAYALASSTAGHLKDDPSYDGLLIAVWAFIAGALAGTIGYFALGGILHWSVRGLGSQGSYRRTRHVLAFACVPLMLSLVLWPFKLALYGQDIFRRGGSDGGTGAHIFTILELGFAVWALALLVIGVRAVHGWSWPRAGAACALAVAAPALLGLAIATL
jgi:hypothetical protein